MRWIKVEPKQDNWQKQYDLIAYDGMYTAGSIVLDNDGEGEWHSVIDDVVEFIVASDLEEAKEEFYDRLEMFIEGEIDFYSELSDLLDDLRESEVTADDNETDD